MDWGTIIKWSKPQIWKPETKLLFVKWQIKNISFPVAFYLLHHSLRGSAQQPLSSRSILKPRVSEFTPIQPFWILSPRRTGKQSCNNQLKWLTRAFQGLLFSTAQSVPNLQHTNASRPTISPGRFYSRGQQSMLFSSVESPAFLMSSQATETHKNLLFFEALKPAGCWYVSIFSLHRSERGEVGKEHYRRSYKAGTFHFLLATSQGTL